jgi:hypothetical protein
MNAVRHQQHLSSWNPSHEDHFLLWLKISRITLPSSERLYLKNEENLLLEEMIFFGNIVQFQKLNQKLQGNYSVTKTLQQRRKLQTKICSRQLAIRETKGAKIL